MASVLFVVGLYAPAWPQEVTRRDSYWVGVGAGAGSEGFSGQLNGGYRFGPNLLSFRLAGTSGVLHDEMYDFGVLYGRANRGARDQHLISAALGVALVDGCQGGGVFADCADRSAVIGVPLEVQLFWRPGSTVGLGVHGFANFNCMRSFAGATLGLQLGRLR